MALIACKDCGKSISKKAESCPSCGAKIPHTSFITKLFAGLFILVVAVIIFAKSSSNNTPQSPQPIKSAQQIEEEKLGETRFQKTLLVIRMLKDSMKNPESFKIDKAHANDDGSVICVAYYAQNSFGASLRDVAVYAKDKLIQDDATINKYCKGKELYDMGYVRQALR